MEFIWYSYPQGENEILFINWYTFSHIIIILAKRQAEHYKGINISGFP